MRLQFVEARGPDDFARAFSEISKARAGALTLLTSSMFFQERRRLVDLVARNQLPAVYPWREGVDTGGLKTAKALGLTIPPALLLRADQVIE